MLNVIIISLAIIFVLSIIGNHIYRKVKHLPTGECAMCKKNQNTLLKKYRKKYKKF